jgi:uncharacterized membrane protein
MASPNTTHGIRQSGFLPVRVQSSTVILVRTGAGGAVPALRWYQVVQYSGRCGIGSTGKETVLLYIEVIAVLCFDMVDFFRLIWRLRTYNFCRKPLS